MKTKEQQAQIIALELLRDMETGDTFDFVDVSMIYETNFAVAIRAVDILYCMNYVEAVEGEKIFWRGKIRRLANFFKENLKIEYFSVDFFKNQRYNTIVETERRETFRNRNTPIKEGQRK